MTDLLAARGVDFSYGARKVLSGVDFVLAESELVALVGPNGAGKSTLLHVLLGLSTPERGTVELAGDRLEGLSRREIARRAAFVPQDARIDFDFTVREVVAMGRTPHLGRFEPERAVDVRAVDAALAATGTAEYAERSVVELSGGERQRVHVARALAQETRVLLFDEPTASLDIEHQLDVMSLLRRLVSEGKSAVVALHDLALAARYATRMVVLAENRVVASGAPPDVVTEELLLRYFHIRAKVRRDDEGALIVVPIASSGAGSPRRS